MVNEIPVSNSKLLKRNCIDLQSMCGTKFMSEISLKTTLQCGTMQLILISVAVRINPMTYSIPIYIWLSYLCIESYVYIS